MNRFLRLLAVLACVVGILHFSEPLPVQVTSHAPDGFRWDFQPTAHAQAGINSGGINFRPPGSGGGGAGVFSTASATSFILRDSSGVNTWTDAGGDHTANRTATWTAGTDSTMALDSGRLGFGQALKVGPVGDAWTVEAGTIAVELVAKNTAANVEIHAEGGVTTGYAGFGARNDLLVDGSNLTRAGSAWLAHGSTSATVYGGRSLANASSFVNAGADSTGLAFGTTTIDPMWFFVQTATGSEPRLDFAATCSALTDNTAGNFKQIDVASGSVTGGLFVYTIYAFGGGVLQTTSGATPFSAVNTAGTEVCGIGNTVGVDFLNVAGVGSGTLGSVAFTSSTSPTNGCMYLAQADSSLVGPTMAICVTTFKNAGVGGIITQ